MSRSQRRHLVTAPVPSVSESVDVHSEYGRHLDAIKNASDQLLMLLIQHHPERDVAGVQDVRLIQR